MSITKATSESGQAPVTHPIGARTAAQMRLDRARRIDAEGQGRTGVAAYIRTNRAGEEAFGRQIGALCDIEAPLEMWIDPESIFSDNASGRDRERPGLAALRAGVRAGEFIAVIVPEFATLSRSYGELAEIKREFDANAVWLVDRNWVSPRDRLR